MATVDLENLVKRYGALEVVHNINLSISDGEFLVLVGPSGCGKSTLLRMLAGLEDISGGDIKIGENIVNEVEPRNRDIAMVFQDYALYPHMTVYDNMAFSLLYRKTPKSEIRQRVEEVAQVLELTPLLERRPKELSGGQRQRVAMGRAIVREPQVFLFDEPLSNLDAKLRGSMRMEIKRLHRRFGVTTVYVTHDQIEAMTLADRVVVMNGGHIEQIGTPDEVYQNPQTQFVAGFIGSPTMNFLPARLDEKGNLNVADGTFTLSGRIKKNAKITNYVVGFRPENIGLDGGDVVTASQSDAYASVECVVEEVEALGADTLLFVALANQRITARILPDANIKPGQKIRVRFDLAKMHLFNEESGEVVT